MRGKICTVCDLEVNQKYCGNCGQKLGESDTTMLSIVKDFFSNLLSVERSVFACIYKLFMDPKSIVENYWKGNRKYYPSPGKMFFYSLAVAVLHLSYVSDEIFGMNLSMPGVGNQITFWTFFLPILVLASYLTFFRKKISFTKHLISIDYLASAFFMVCLITQDILEYFFPELIEGYMFIVFAIGVFVWNAIVFTSSKKYSAIAINTFIEMLAFIMIALALVGLIYLFIPIKFS